MVFKPFVTMHMFLQIICRHPDGVRIEALAEELSFPVGRTMDVVALLMRNRVVTCDDVSSPLGRVRAEGQGLGNAIQTAMNAGIDVNHSITHQ